jgi:hypothetical protein
MKRLFYWVCCHVLGGHGWENEQGLTNNSGLPSMAHWVCSRCGKTTDGWVW